MQAGFLGMLLVPPRVGGTAPFLTLYFAVFSCYLFAAVLTIRRPGISGESWDRRVVTVLAFSVLFRVGFVAAAPALSDDALRYMWDGRVVASGMNPYSEPPSSPHLADLRDERFARLPHTNVRTIYPPLAQALFAATALAGWGVSGLKALLIVADLAVILALRRILALGRVSPLRILIYAWNPLAVIEVAWSGHLEPAGVVCVLIATVAIIQKRDLRAAVAMTAGGLVKLLPFLLLVPFLRSMRWRALLAVPVLVSAAYWPFRAAGGELASGLGEYARRWLANESVFGVLHAALAACNPTPALKAAIAWVRIHVPWSGAVDLLYPYVYPMDLARGVCALVVIVVAWAILRRGIDPLRGVYLLTGTVLVLSPTLHPWYLLWLLPWLCLLPSRAWILMSGLVVLVYANLGATGREAEPYPWVRWLEYTPFYLLLVGDWLRARTGGARASAAPEGVRPEG
jgi:hypothetical protein